MTKDDVPGIKRFHTQTGYRLANGNTLISNWFAGNKNTADGRAPCNASKSLRTSKSSGRWPHGKIPTWGHPLPSSFSTSPARRKRPSVDS